MTLSELTEYELESLDHRATQFMNTVQDTLSKIRNGERVVLRLDRNDRYRLLTLKMWSERYRVPVKYILETLMAWTETFARKHFRRTRTEGFGVKVSTLCGKKSEQILETQIAKDFPNGEHKLAFIQVEQTRILEWEVRRLEKLEQQESDGIQVNGHAKKSLLDYEQPRVFVRHYKKRIQREGQQRAEIVKEMMKRNYRGNPFLPETI